MGPFDTTTGQNSLDKSMQDMAAFNNYEKADEKELSEAAYQSAKKHQNLIQKLLTKISGK